MLSSWQPLAMVGGDLIKTKLGPLYFETKYEAELYARNYMHAFTGGGTIEGFGVRRVDCPPTHKWEITYTSARLVELGAEGATA